MATYTFPWQSGISVLPLLPLLPRPPVAVRTGQDLALDYDPDLSSGELTAVTDTVAALVSSMDSPLSLTPEEWTGIRPHITTIRDLRQMGRNAFMALTAAERDRLLYDAQSATTTIILAVLRD